MSANTSNSIAPRERAVSCWKSMPTCSDLPTRPTLADRGGWREPAKRSSPAPRSLWPILSSGIGFLYCPPCTGHENGRRLSDRERS